MIEVIGGCYHETCLAPPVHQFYGSGGRAAAMLSAAGFDVKLHTFVAPEAKNHAQRLAALSDFEVIPYKSLSQISFAYVNSLFTPIMYPLKNSFDEIGVETASPVLLFGMVEGRARVKSPIVVFDPQGAHQPSGFRASGLECERLTIICMRQNWKRSSQEIRPKPLECCWTEKTPKP